MTKKIKIVLITQTSSKSRNILDILGKKALLSCTDILTIKLGNFVHMSRLPMV